jgi:hypothetical protein
VLPAPARTSGNDRANVRTWFFMSPPRTLTVPSEQKRQYTTKELRDGQPF